MRISKRSWSLLLFSVGACHEKSKSLLLFIFCTLKGINLLWRGDGLVFLKCLLCYYSSKKEISSALSRVSSLVVAWEPRETSCFHFLNLRPTALRKSWDISGLLRATCKLVAIIGSELSSCCLLPNWVQQGKAPSCPQWEKMAQSDTDETRVRQSLRP